MPGERPVAAHCRRVEGFGQAAKPDTPHPQCFDNCFIDRARRSSFHTITVSPLRANSSASCKAGRLLHQLANPKLAVAEAFRSLAADGRVVVWTAPWRFETLGLCVFT
jgi:hypothetical protein